MSVWESIKDTVNQGVQASKKALSGAASRTKELKDVSVLRLEVRDRQTKRNRLCSELGKTVYEKLLTSQTIGRGNSAIKDTLEAIGTIDEEIAEKQAQIEKLSVKKD